MKIYQVDAFTSNPFAGNPAAVVLLDGGRSDEWMQALAEENNLSETAYVEDRGDSFGLRWFTPKVEVDLCGHATLATAHVLYERGRLARSAAARFLTRSGDLVCKAEGDFIFMDFPADSLKPMLMPPELEDVLGLRPVYTGRGREDILIEIASEDKLRALRPNLRALGQMQSRGVIVTAESKGGEFDFVSRFFAPAAGIDEDPVTGSAHTTLAVYWAKRLGKTEFMARQVSSRGGSMKVSLRGERVVLGGQAVTVFEGELKV